MLCCTGILSLMYERAALVLVCGVSMLCVSIAFAQDAPTDGVPNTIASAFAIDGEVQDGDIVSYDVERGVYVPAQQTADRNMFGVVADDPVLFVGDGEDDTGMRPIVRYGESIVNVSTLNGEVQAGDFVTTSRVIGVGQRVGVDTATYILGIATSPMSFTGETVLVDGETVRLGQVPVALRIGFFSDGTDDAEFDELRALYASSAAAMQSSVENESNRTGLDFFLLFRYILGAAVTIASILVALRRFGGLFNESVVAVGRNPLAHSQVRSLLIWNTFMIIAVSGVGLVFGVLIIVL